MKRITPLQREALSELPAYCKPDVAPKNFDEADAAIKAGLLEMVKRGEDKPTGPLGFMLRQYTTK